MQRDEPLVRFDRPDEQDIEIIRSPAGVIVYAKKQDYSLFGWLLHTGKVDHFHEASCNTFLDWQLAYLSTRGFKVLNYGQHDGGDGMSDKVTLYLRIIRRMGHLDQKIVTFCLDQYEPSICPLTRRYFANVASRERVARELTAIGDRCIGALERMGRIIDEVRKELDEESACAPTGTALR